MKDAVPRGRHRTQQAHIALGLKAEFVSSAAQDLDPVPGFVWLVGRDNHR